ncbi:MAG: ribosome assembly cofactor RimP [Bacteroidales bacterium]|jgi:ribosome maturation factor RimP|nr:ribosome assembly cofactor RimP [Bacteroidales bacterium]
MISKQEIIDLADQYLLESDSESFLVDVTVSRDNQIVVEIDNDEAVDIDECVQLSQYIEQHLDRNKEDFELEVGSAGLTSPLKVLRQYAKFEGEEVEVLMRDGRKLTGTLGVADDEGFDLTWTTMEKVTDPATGKPGKKKQAVEHNEKLRHADVNQVKYVINF